MIRIFSIYVLFATSLFTLTSCGGARDSDTNADQNSPIPSSTPIPPTSGIYYVSFQNSSDNLRSGKVFVDNNNDFYLLGSSRNYSLSGTYESDSNDFKVTYNEYGFPYDMGGSNPYFGSFRKFPENQISLSEILNPFAQPLNFKYKFSNAPSNYFMEFGFAVSCIGLIVNGRCVERVNLSWYKQDINLSFITNSFNGYDTNGCQFDGIINEHITDSIIKATVTVSSCSAIDPTDAINGGDSQINNGEYTGIGYIDSYESSQNGIPYDVISFNFEGFNAQHAFRLRAFEDDRNL
ncbi:MAG: hypothetical protein H8E21_05010 [Gammaproteobacteria bacterium]|nr:hypothetical protein [Gammaproteobacteria bacterium]